MSPTHTPNITKTSNGIAVSTCATISHSYTFESDVLSPESKAIADFYGFQGRCLCLVDANVYKLMDEKMNKYFKVHGIQAVIRSVDVTEERKDLEKLSEVCEMLVEY